MENKIIDYPGALCNLVYYGILDLGYFSHFLWGFIGIAVTVILCFSTYKKYTSNISQKDNKTNNFLFSSAFFLFLIGLGIFILRIPTFCASELNVDESEWISGAATLIRDFRFWKSVNGTTSGPLNIFPLCLINLLGVSLNYASVRFFSVLFIILPVIFITFKLFKIAYGEIVARIISITLFFFFAFSENFDIVSYNSEHIPMLLMVSAFFFFVRTYENSANNKKDYLHLFFYGLMTGLLPYSKFQAVPITLVLFVFVFSYNIFHKKNITRKNSFLLLGLIIPTALLLIYLYIFNLKEEFFNYYIINNYEYSMKGLLNSSQKWWSMQKQLPVNSWFEKIILFPRLILMSKDTVLYFFALIILSVFGLWVILRNPKSISVKNIEFIIFAFVVFLSVYYAIVKPGNAFLHYIIIIIIPSSMLSGFLFGTGFDIARNRYNKIKFYLKTGLLIFPLLPAIILAFDGNCFIKSILNRNSPCQISCASKVIKRHSVPNDRLVVWGYSNILYVESEMLQGTREPFTYLQITESSCQNYFIEKFCEDMLTNRPKIFVDAIEKNSFFCEDNQKYENCPRVKKIIDECYELKDTTCGVRIFAWKK